MLPLPLAEAVVATASAGLFFALGARRQRRPRGAQEALRLASLWWCALGAFAILEALALGAFAAGLAPATLLPLRVAQALALSVGLFALAAYVAFLVTASRKLYLPLGATCAAYYGALVFRAVALAPVAPDAAWSPDAWLLVPPLVASAGYALASTPHLDRYQRARVALAVLGTVGWVGSLLLRRGAEHPAWGAVPLAVALTSALAILWAYETPRWVRMPTTR